MRTRLPNRRPSETTLVSHDGRDYAVTIGFDPATGAVREVFATDAKSGSAMDGILNDACVALSLLLQHGDEPATLAHSMGRLDGDPVNRPSDKVLPPASIIGASCQRHAFGMTADHLATKEAGP